MFCCLLLIGLFGSKKSEAFEREVEVGLQSDADLTRVYLQQHLVALLDSQSYVPFYLI